MRSMPSHHNALNVSPNAPSGELRVAHREAAGVHHPDLHGGRGEVPMAEINNGWQALSDRADRKRCDAALQSGPDRPAPSATIAPPPPPWWFPTVSRDDAVDERMAPIKGGARYGRIFFGTGAITAVSLTLTLTLTVTLLR